MSKPLVSCFMLTHGRRARACQALACFLAQDCLDQAELVVLNSHPVPLVFAHPRVRIFNEPQHLTLGALVDRVLELVEGEFCRAFDDDDLYLPWSVSQGLAHIGAKSAWKPASSWWTPDGGKNYDLTSNTLEASILFRTDALRTSSPSDPVAPLCNRVPVTAGAMGWWTGYVYSWGCGGDHYSGRLGSIETPEQRVRSWRANNNDVQPGKAMMPDFSGVLEKFHHLSSFVPEDMRSNWWGKVHAAYAKLVGG